jgi:restriction endonuclease Mrr
VPEEVLDRLNPSGGQRFSNQVHWARYFLVESGYVDRSRPGVWRLTELGSSVGILSPTALRSLVDDVQEKSRVQRAAQGPRPNALTPGTNPPSTREVIATL